MVALGLNEIPIEVWKYMEEVCLVWLSMLFNEIVSTSRMPIHVVQDSDGCHLLIKEDTWREEENQKAYYGVSKVFNMVGLRKERI